MRLSGVDTCNRYASSNSYTDGIRTQCDNIDEYGSDEVGIACIYGEMVFAYFCDGSNSESEIANNEKA